MKQYMVIEKFKPGCKGKIYEIFHSKGRMLPEGLNYINSWLEKDGDRCFQLMETNDPQLFQVWQNNWKDLGDFGTIEVVEIGEKPAKDEWAFSAWLFAFGKRLKPNRQKLPSD